VTLPSHMFKDPAKVYESSQYFTLGCGACACHKPKPDLTEYHCIAEQKQWPDGTNKTCTFFARRKKARGPNP